MPGDRNPRDTEPLDVAGAPRPAAVARARSLLDAGATVGSYVLAGAIIEETMRAVCWGRQTGTGRRISGT